MAPEIVYIQTTCENAFWILELGPLSGAEFKRALKCSDMKDWTGNRFYTHNVMWDIIANDRNYPVPKNQAWNMLNKDRWTYPGQLDLSSARPRYEQIINKNIRFR